MATFQKLIIVNVSIGLKGIPADAKTLKFEYWRSWRQNRIAERD